MTSIKTVVSNMKKVHNILKKKVPTSKERYIGIEVELVSPVSRDMFAFLISQVGLSKWVNVGTDDSIECDDSEYGDGTESGLECRILCKEKELKTILPKFFKLTTEIGCYVNSSCGLHVHLDARSRNFIKMAKNFYSAQELLYSVVNDSRRDNDYCYPLSFDKYEFFVNNGGHTGHLSRTGINLTSYSKHKTIEIRIHHGSLNAVDVLQWIKLLITIANLKTPVEGWDLLTSKYIAMPTKTWINRKVKQYGKYTFRETDSSYCY